MKMGVGRNSWRLKLRRQRESSLKKAVNMDVLQDMLFMWF